MSHDEVLGEYRLDGLLGEGSTAQVWRAVDGSGSKFALKVLRFDVPNSPALMRSVGREIDLATRLHSPHVARIVDANLGHTPPFLVYELVDGDDVDTLVARSGPLPTRVGASLVLGSVRGLCDLHAAGIVHRDINPSNVVIGRSADGVTAKLVDLGIARVAEQRTGTYTRAGAHTAAYSSPEQLDRTHPITPASDIFSWASTIYFALTGTAPFGQEETAAFRTITQRRYLPNLSALDAGLADLLVDCWIAEPGQRPGAAEVLDRLEHADATTAGVARPQTDPRLSFKRRSVTMWGELGAHMRSFRRRRNLSRTALARLSDFPRGHGPVKLFLYELGRLPVPRDVVRYYDRFFDSAPALEQFYHFAVHDDRVRGRQDFGAAPPSYPVPGDASGLRPGEDAVVSTGPNEDITIVVHLRNVGLVPWRSRVLTRFGPARGPFVLTCPDELSVPDLDPGGEAEIVVPLRTPGVSGRFAQRFKMTDLAGNLCFPAKPQGLIIVVDVTTAG